jgi:hypothetical protein
MNSALSSPPSSSSSSSGSIHSMIAVVIDGETDGLILALHFQ